MTRAKRQKCIGVNDADYVVKQTIKNTDGTITRTQCPYHAKWASMIDRVYNSNKECTRHQTYEGVTVCNEWLTFSNFKKWMELQNWEGKFLDKDLLSQTTPSTYCPESCAFISPRLNRLIARGFYPRKVPMPVGVEWVRVSSTNPAGKFEVNIQVSGKKQYVGRYASISTAVLAYTLAKVQQLIVEREVETDSRIKTGLSRYISNYANESKREAKMWQEYFDSNT